MKNLHISQGENYKERFIEKDGKTSALIWPSRNGVGCSECDGGDENSNDDAVFRRPF